MNHKTLYLLLLLVIIASCGIKNQKVKQRILDSEYCKEQKNIIENEYEKQNISETINKFKSFEDCSLDKIYYNIILARLYKEDNQYSKSAEMFNEIEKEILSDWYNDSNENLLRLGTIYILREEKEKLKENLKKIDYSNLSEDQKEQFEFFEMYANMGEFVTGTIKLELFN